MLNHYLVAAQLAWLGQPWAAPQAWRVAMARVQVAVVVAAAVAVVAAWWGLDTSL